MKKTVCVALFLLILLPLSACFLKEERIFTKKAGDLYVSPEGVEYSFLAVEGTAYYLGETEFFGRIEGEPESFRHLGLTMKTGFYTLKGAKTDHILVRCVPDCEWFFLYRRADLPPIDLSADRCVRLEWVEGYGYGLAKKHEIHASCGAGITDPGEIADFLSEVRSQQDPRETGLYDLFRGPDGMFENVTIGDVLYGFFAEEPLLALRMAITSFDGKAYSITIGEREYVLPDKWVRRLRGASCPAP